MSQNQELNSSQIEQKEAQTNRVLCYLDSQIPLKFDDLAKYFTKKLALPVVPISGRLDQKNLLQQIENINAKDLFVFFLKIVHGEQINELYGKWRRTSPLGAKSIFVILDCSVPSFRSDSDNLPTQRYLEMKQDPNTKVILLGEGKLNAADFNQAVDQITNN